MSNVKSKLKHPFLFVLSLVLCLLSLIPASLGAKVGRSLTARPYDLNQLTPDTAYESQIVSGQIFGSLGCFGQLYKTDKDGNLLGEDQYTSYFLLPINNEYSIVLTTDEEKLTETLNLLTAATDMYRNGETNAIEQASFDYSGMLIALNNDELTRLYSWVLSTGLFGAESVEEASANIVPYKIVTYNRNGALPYLIGGCAGFIIFAVLTVKLLKTRVLIDENGDIVEDGGKGKKSNDQ